MPSYFRRTRCVELSTIEYLERMIENSWSGVTVVKSFQQSYDEAVPVVCIRLDETFNGKLEIGSTTYSNTYTIIVDIFAKSDAQRLDLSDFIMEQIKGTWTYCNYAHNSGRTDIVGTPDGKVSLATVTYNRKVEIFDAVASQDKFRHLIMFLVRKF